MSSALIVTAPGTAASIQDMGRFGHRRFGVPWSGTLAPELLVIANRLVGNTDGAPAIECFSGGQAFTAGETAVRVAVAGDGEIEIESGGVVRHVRAWQSHRLLPGETLRIRAVHDGRTALLSLAGLEVPLVLGSASAHTRSGLGGGWLAAGTRIACAAAQAAPELRLDDVPESSDAPYRVIAGPQAEHFDARAWEAFLSSKYRIGQAADRMGMRLEGAALNHRDAARREIVSDAVIPGAIQVPGHGQPIVLLADAQTAGGYPKIATVISADLPRLATRKPGETVRFACVDAATGEQAAQAAAAALNERLTRLRRLTAEGIDLAVLYPDNE
jgi:allophanate hydrolase